MRFCWWIPLGKSSGFLAIQNCQMTPSRGEVSRFIAIQCGEGLSFGRFHWGHSVTSLRPMPLSTAPERPARRPGRQLHVPLRFHRCQMLDHLTQSSIFHNNFNFRVDYICASCGRPHNLILVPPMGRSNLVVYLIWHYTPPFYSTEWVFSAN